MSIGIKGLGGFPIFGLRLLSTPHAKTLVSGQIFKAKRWMRGRCYANRMQKKLNRKFGPPVYEPAILRTADCIFVHPSLYEKVRLAMSN